MKKTSKTESTQSMRAKSTKLVGLTFLDLSNGPLGVENHYPLYVIRQLIASHTGRSLVFDQCDLSIPLGLPAEFRPVTVNQYSEYFKLVRFPDPVGFAIVANKDIAAGTFLFSYGGEKLSAEDVEQKNKALSSSDYLLTADNAEHKFHVQDAAEFGGLGALLAHLPSQEFIADHFDSSQAALIQAQNVEIFGMTIALLNAKPYKEIFFRATQPISSGSVIGFDYGSRYWCEKAQSPVYFQKGKLSFINPVSTYPEIVLCNAETDSARFEDLETKDSCSFHFPLKILNNVPNLFKNKLYRFSVNAGRNFLSIETEKLANLLNFHSVGEEQTSASKSSTKKYNQSFLFLPARYGKTVEIETKKQSQSEASVTAALM